VPFEKAIETLYILFVMMVFIQKYVTLLTIYLKHVMYVENMLTALRKSLKINFNLNSYLESVWLKTLNHGIESFL